MAQRAGTNRQKAHPRWPVTPIQNRQALRLAAGCHSRILGLLVEPDIETEMKAASGERKMRNQLLKTVSSLGEMQSSLAALIKLTRSRIPSKKLAAVALTSLACAAVLPAFAAAIPTL